MFSSSPVHADPFLYSYNFRMGRREESKYAKDVRLRNKNARDVGSRDETIG